MIQDLLGISSVELWPVAILLPWLWEQEHSIPNPVAYIPQYVIPYSVQMVCVLQEYSCCVVSVHIPAAISENKALLAR